MDLPRDRVDLWLARVPVAGEIPSAFGRWLSIDERGRIDALLRPTSRRQRLVAYAARRAVLSFYPPCDPSACRFVDGGDARSELLAAPGTSPLCVSLSHTKGLVAVAVTQTPDVGADVEWIDPRRRVAALAKHCFAREEITALCAAAPEARPALFATIWTLKESYLKARGVGIWAGVDLQACRFELAADSRTVAFHPGPETEDRPDEWRFFALQPTPCHRAAVAVRGAGARSPVLRAFALADALDVFRSESGRYATTRLFPSWDSCPEEGRQWTT